MILYPSVLGQRHYKMRKLNLEILEIGKMASGHLSLELTEKVSWENSPKFVDKFLKLLNGKVTSTTDGFDLRIWNVIINHCKYQLTFDDYPIMVALESDTVEADAELLNILEILRNR
jgi:Protein of unknown function (DUF3630)